MIAELLAQWALWAQPWLHSQSAWVWVVGVVAFLMGGVVKGAMGVGLPLLAVPMMSLMIPAHQAMALVVVPVVTSNIWQAYSVGEWRQNLQRFWPLSLAQMVTVFITVRMTLELEARAFNRLLAVALLLAVVLMAFRPSFSVSRQRERPISALMGVLSGILGAVSALTGPVIITYLMALRLQRTEFLGAISIIYLFGSLPLYTAMAVYDRLGWSDIALSALALLPMTLGIRVGTALGKRWSEHVFRKALYIYLVCMAGLLALR